MDIQTGDIVRATAGRDKNKVFIVTEIVSENLIKICDGVSRKIEKPKLKKKMHVSKLSGDGRRELEELLKGTPGEADSHIRTYLKQFK